MTANICPYCGGPLPICVIPGPTGKYIEVPVEPCSETIRYHQTPEQRWDWFGDDRKCTNTLPAS